AARAGGDDPDANPRLRSAIAAAKGVNMPKDNIERAIARGAGGGEGGNIDEIRYEGYGQGGVAILVDCMTDNRNRTVSDVRSAFTKGGGNLGESGCVSWMFHQKGQLILDNSENTEEAIMEAAMDAEAEDIIDKPDEGCIEVITEPAAFAAVQDTFEKAGLTPRFAEIVWIPENTIEVEGEVAEKLLGLIERLEELDDVQNVYANFDIPDDELARIQG
ncbi:MAG: YebC/PmpR family DNA-binding transcriptional regulator, partial [Mariprofundus sp.]